jgi:hypothetical protein
VEIGGLFPFDRVLFTGEANTPWKKRTTAQARPGKTGPGLSGRFASGSLPAGAILSSGRSPGRRRAGVWAAPCQGKIIFGTGLDRTGLDASWNVCPHCLRISLINGGWVFKLQANFLFYRISRLKNTSNAIARHQHFRCGQVRKEE